MDLVTQKRSSDDLAVELLKRPKLSTTKFKTAHDVLISKTATRDAQDCIKNLPFPTAPKQSSDGDTKHGGSEYSQADLVSMQRFEAFTSTF